jgi:hypothetical protein
MKKISVIVLALIVVVFGLYFANSRDSIKNDKNITPVPPITENQFIDLKTETKFIRNYYVKDSFERKYGLYGTINSEEEYLALQKHMPEKYLQKLEEFGQPIGEEYREQTIIDVDFSSKTLVWGIGYYGTPSKVFLKDGKLNLVYRHAPEFKDKGGFFTIPKTIGYPVVASVDTTIPNPVPNTVIKGSLLP